MHSATVPTHTHNTLLSLMLQCIHTTCTANSLSRDSIADQFVTVSIQSNAVDDVQTHTPCSQGYSHKGANKPVLLGL